MKGLYGSKIGTIFRLLILVLFLILCFFIKRNVELMLPEAVEYAVLDNCNKLFRGGRGGMRRRRFNCECFIAYNWRRINK